MLNDIKTEVNDIKPSKPKFVEGTVVNTLMLNVRESPSMESNILNVLYEDTIVIIDTSFVDKDWYKIKTKTITSITGYVLSKFISIKE